MKKRIITGSVIEMTGDVTSPQVYYAKVQFQVFKWWFTIKTIVDMCPWYPEARAKEILGLLPDEQ